MVPLIQGYSGTLILGMEFFNNGVYVYIQSLNDRLTDLSDWSAFIKLNIIYLFFILMPSWSK